MQTISRLLSFHHNVSKFKPKYMVGKKAIDILLPYVDSTNQLLAMKSLLTLSYLISEEQNHMISSTDGKVLRQNLSLEEYNKVFSPFFLTNK